VSYWRVILKGSLGSVEVWSTSIAMGIIGLSPDVADQATTDAMSAALVTATNTTNIPSALRTCLSSSGSVDAVRVERRREDETVLNVSERLLGSPMLGLTSVTKTPQDAVVLSLRTSTPGARGRGRLYWPALAATLNGSFQLTTPTTAQVAADTKVWIASIKSAMDGVYVSAASALRVAPSVRSATDHVCRDLTSIQVGSVLDTQRRRRDNLPESYSNVAYP